MSDNETMLSKMKNMGDDMDNGCLERVTVNCQSSIRIAGSKVLYFDPFEVEDELHDADVIFITHEHYDHFQPESIAKVKNDGTILVAPKSMQKKAMTESGIGSEHLVFCEPGEKQTICDIAVETVAAYNKRMPFHPKSNHWLGYVVTLDETRYFVAGDTDPNEENRKVKCDVALIPIGGHYTMDKKHGADFVACLKPLAAVPTHYGKVVGKPEDGMDFKDYVEIIDPEIRVELKL